jgi:hypothetical protein
MTDDNWYLLPAPAAWGQAERAAFIALARAISGSSPAGDGPDVHAARHACLQTGQVSLIAAANVLGDLASQGWSVIVDDGAVRVAPALSVADPAGEKDRIRRQELVKRNEQLSLPSVRKFITGLERPREYHGRFVSVFSLMRDGRDLAAVLEAATGQPSALRAVIDPYVQPVATGERCRHTGLLLTDIWRYFRQTWTNYYATTPGRTLQLLIRDRAAPFHPVIGIAALSSAIVQISERDDWIGWQPGPFLTDRAANPTARMARWAAGRLERSLSELYLDDLLRDGLYWPSLWDSPTPEAIERLVKEAESRRRDHHRFVHQSDFKSRSGKADDAAWRQRAESDLFRSKRCLKLADVLRARTALIPYLSPRPTADGLRKALADPQGRRAIAGILRRAKSESVGTAIADLAVCGAVAPYNAILGGKLVSMLATGPAAVRAYRDKYSGYESEIASAMAGRAIQRRANLVFIGTTSLYGSGSSQYNRIRVPADVLGGTDDIRFRELGRSKSYGTSHLSAESVTALSQTGVRVNSIFGEGVNPKLRKVRYGLDLLGWPSGELLQHGRQRIVYGISLASNLLPYLIGAEDKPRYLFPVRSGGDVAKISEWWMQRWLAHRIQSADVLAEVARHHADRPVNHGARVPLPPADKPDDGLFLYEPRQH